MLNVAAIHTSEIICSVILISIEDLGHQRKQILHPFMGNDSFLVRMLADRDRFRDLRTACRATAIDGSLFGTGCGYGLFYAEIMSLTRQDLGIPITAACARIQNAAVRKASGRCDLGAVGVSRCRDEIGSDPLTAHRANSLVAALLGARGSAPYRIRIHMLTTNMLTLQNKRMVTAHGHSIGITAPTAHCISLLFCNLGRNDFAAVRQAHLSKQCCTILGIEAHGVGSRASLKDGICVQIKRRGSGNAIGNAVTVQIPADQHLGILLSLFGDQFGLTDDLRGQEDLITEKIAVFIIKVCNDPFIAVHDSVVIVPERIVCIPAQIGFKPLHVNCDTLDTTKCMVLHGDALLEHNRL